MPLIIPRKSHGGRPRPPGFHLGWGGKAAKMPIAHRSNLLDIGTVRS